LFSIGTNDLVQYTLAADRTSPELADVATAFQPAVPRLIDGVCRAAQAHELPGAVCGDAAANPLLAPLLVGLGVTHLSVATHSLSAVNQTLAGVDLAACRAAANAALQAQTSAGVQEVAEVLLRAPGPGPGPHAHLMGCHTPWLRGCRPDGGDDDGRPWLAPPWRPGAIRSGIPRRRNRRTGLFRPADHRSAPRRRADLRAVLTCDMRMAEVAGGLGLALAPT
jgi:hypothetical protein